MGEAGGNAVKGVARDGRARPEEGPDNSLRGNALRRAQEGDVPTTLTPWEWEEWYREKGMPDAFRGAASDSMRARPMRQVAEWVKRVLKK